MSKFNFLDEYKKAKGMTPYQFIIQLKLEKSRELLINSPKQTIETTYILDSLIKAILQISLEIST